MNLMRTCPTTQRASTAPVRFPSCHIGPGHLIRSRTTGLTPMACDAHEGAPRMAPLVLRLPPLMIARPRRRTRGGGCFSKTILNESVPPPRWTLARPPQTFRPRGGQGARALYGHLCGTDFTNSVLKHREGSPYFVQCFRIFFECRMVLARRIDHGWALSAFGPATFLGFLGGFVNSKVFQLCACFELFPQPDGLRSPACPRVP